MDAQNDHGVPTIHHHSKVQKIQFGVLDPDYIRKMSVTQIMYPEIYEDGNSNKPKANGLFDLKMGPIEEHISCPTCGYKRDKCNGHFGHIELGAPVYNPGFIEETMLVLRCVCHCCSRLLVNKKDIKIRKLKYVATLSKKKKYRTCGNNNAEETEEVTIEYDDDDDDTLIDDIYTESIDVSETANGGCGAIQHTYQKDGIKIYIVHPKDPERDGAEKRKDEMTPTKALRILEKISDTDARYLGFGKYCKPHNLIISVLPVPPPCVRPSVQMDSSRRGEDDLTQKLIDIIKSNNSFSEYSHNQAPAEFKTNLYGLLRYHVATFMDNDIPNVEKAQQRSGRDLKAIVQRLKGKEGRVRQNLMGKRVDQSARTVIDPDPNIGIQELGVPLKIAMTCSYKETVNDYNREWLMQLVRNGPYIHPGANSIIKGGKDVYMIRNLRDPLIMNLENGDQVERHLIDGDLVIFNRQPTLHRPSMMGHFVRVMANAKSFRLNLAVTTPYNADFDGDKLFKSCPQKVELSSI